MNNKNSIRREPTSKNFEIHKNNLNVLVLGSGGREHALVRELSKAKSVKKLFAGPGNCLMTEVAEILPEIQFKTQDDFKKIQEFCESQKIDLVIVGPEDPLVAGICDFLRKSNIAVFGPEAAAAQLEGSKSFCKEFMRNEKIPTAKYFDVCDVEETLSASKSFAPPYVLKADGLAAGKGVVICENTEHLRATAKNFFESKSLGEAGAKAVLEEFLSGYELSYLVITNGEEYQGMPIAMDHKRLKNDNLGPNTGGMGTIAPLNISKELANQIENEIVKPTVLGIKRNGWMYRGVLFFGLMIDKSGPKLLEINCRFGDPETQVVLPLIEGAAHSKIDFDSKPTLAKDLDLAQFFYNVANGILPSLRFCNKFAACVVMAAPGYPDSPEKGIAIQIEKRLQEFDSRAASYILGAGVKLQNNKLVSNGGRVLNSLGVGESLEEALKNSYDQLGIVKFEKMQYRTDIGKHFPKI